MYKIDVSEFKNQKTAFVLSGGVVKAAAWHLGVALALEELGFTLKHNTSQESDYEISTYVGSSAGALISTFFANGFSPRDIIESNLERKHGRIPPITYRDMLSLKSPLSKPQKSDLYKPFDGFPIFLQQLLKPILKVSGFFTTQGLYEYIIKNVLMSNNFEDLEADLFIVATQLDHSRKCIFSKYKYPSPAHDSTATYYTNIPIAESVAASTAVPPFYSPYPIKNPQTEKTDYFFDGEIRETLSTHVAVDNRCKYIISSWTHTPYHYHDEIGSLINFGLPAICMQAIYLLIQKKIVESRAKRHMARDVLAVVNEYLKDNKFDEKKRLRLLDILEKKMNYQRDVKLIDIYPSHSNHKIFFRNSFSLNPEKTADLVSFGYRRTIQIFHRREWER
jgi:predicted acylesterase/phospholipase RssA